MFFKMVYTITYTPNNNFLRASEIFSGQVKPSGYLPGGQVKLSWASENLMALARRASAMRPDELMEVLKTGMNFVY